MLLFSTKVILAMTLCVKEARREWLGNGEFSELMGDLRWK